MASIVGGHFGRLPDQRDVSTYTLTNDAGMQVTVLSWGARIAGCRVSDRDGTLANVVLAHSDFDGWVADPHYLGATIGRVANRIANAACKLDDTTLELPANDGDHHLHGGHEGFDRKLWDGVIERDADGGQALSMYLESAEGDQGYPGRLAVRQRFSLDDHNTLTVEVMARATEPTLFAPTLHPYFNLTGDPTQPVREHRLQVRAARWMPVDAQGIPTGELADVEDTPLDFRDAMTLGERADDALLAARGGYDHALVLDGAEGDMRLAAILVEPESGRRLAIATTMPTLQLFVGRDLALGDKRADGVCLEPQHHPDAVNNDTVASPILRPDARYYARTTFRFDTLPAAADPEEPRT
ncbi:MAG: aldose epimerase family protein [Pseudomonadota bacterium]